MNQRNLILGAAAGVGIILWSMLSTVLAWWYGEYFLRRTLGWIPEGSGTLGLATWFLMLATPLIAWAIATHLSKENKK